MYVPALVAGLVLLLWSADRFVEGSSRAAEYAGVPAVLIGMIIVGFGTSVPELLVSALAAAEGNSGIALGNVLGSNIANIALIIGVSAVVAPMAVHSSVIKRELPMLAAVTVIGSVLLLDRQLGRLDALLMLAVFAAVLWWSIKTGNANREDGLAVEIRAEASGGAMSPKSAILWIIIGLLILLLSSRLLIWSATGLARIFGVSETIIGLTIIAVGTSLPELASSVLAARRGRHELALGNVIGSNIFNLMMVTGLAGIIRPLKIEPLVLNRDVPSMAFVTVLLFLFAFGFRGRPGRINRVEGLVLIMTYILYSFLVFLLTADFNAMTI